MKTVIILVIVILIVIGGFFLLRGGDGVLPPDEEAAQEEEAAGDAEEAEEGAAPETGTATHTLSYTDSGFESPALTVSLGDTVVWENRSSRQMWVASAVHPTHTVYPGSSIAKCGTAEEGTFFDQCGGVSFGSSYRFTFDEEGEWGFHNHLAPSHTGRITAESR